MMTTTPEALRAWGRHTHGSPLYKHLTEVIADDPDLLRVMGRIEHLPQANLVLGAVQLLLMAGEGPELAAFYLSMTEHPLPVEGVGQPFRRFVLDHEEEIVTIGNARYTQTNEVRRCVALLPMVAMASFNRFHLIDVGTSAGLNLGLDRYRYRYDGLEWGPDSPLVLTAESRGVSPQLKDLVVLRRIGLDLNPIDPGDDDARRWIDALIWPEHVERRARLRTALELVSNLGVEFVAGDALTTLPGVLVDLPEGEAAIVINSFTLIQFTAAERGRLEDICDDARSTRSVFRVSMEAIDKRDDWAVLAVDDGSGPRRVGQAHPHGEWIELGS
jgi:hypothetical protein